MNKDPLDTLFVSQDQIDTEQKTLLAEVLGPLVAIEAESGRVHFKSAADKLASRHRILIFLMARLALSSRPNANHLAAVTPSEIEQGTGLPGNSVRPRVQELLSAHLIAKAGSGGYCVNPATLRRACDELKSAISKTQ